MQDKDKSALEYIYDHYGAALYGTILSVVHSEHLASEVLHDAFLKIWSSIEMYDPKRGKLFTWMINIARNLAIDKTRSKEIKQEKKTETVQDNVHIIDGAASARVPVDHIGVKDIVKELKDDYRFIVELLYFKGYTQAEISKEYNIPLGTVKTRTRAALLELRRILE
ncbi:RNA polymerase sigma factor [Saccharicrinis sp. FJH54]|uniref:RNA polymerase sigma factor n=1 Tax=Saccharicrinis sp. FJH54 TaxID=3344665 RepID=UPI0035D49DF2